MKTPAANPLFTRACGPRAPLQVFSGQLVGAVPSPRDWTRSQRRAFPLHLFAAVLILLEGGCGTAPIRPFQPSAKARVEQAAQTRRFDGITKPAMLTACACLLQDLGFIIEEADGTLGVITGSKNRTAEEQKTTGGALLEATAKVAVFLAVVMLTKGGGASSHSEDPSDRQTIRVSLTVAPGSSENPDHVVVSLTLNRVVYSQGNKELKNESVHDPVLTQAFFEALSKSVFLEAHVL